MFLPNLKKVHSSQTDTFCYVLFCNTQYINQLWMMYLLA